MKSSEQKEALSVEIQEASISDAEALSNIQKNTWIDTYISEEYGITKEDILAKGMGTPLHIAKWEATIEKPNTKAFVAKVSGVAVGFCFAKKEGNQGRIGSIYILPEFHAKGLGRKLMDQAILYLGRENPILLEVATYNKNAINFYKKMGFKETGGQIAEDQTVRFPNGMILPEIEMVLPKIS